MINSVNPFAVQKKANSVPLIWEIFVDALHVTVCTAWPCLIPSVYGKNWEIVFLSQTAKLRHGSAFIKMSSRPPVSRIAGTFNMAAERRWPFLQQIHCGSWKPNQTMAVMDSSMMVSLLIYPWEQQPLMVPSVSMNQRTVSSFHTCRCSQKNIIVVISMHTMHNL